MGTCLEVDTFPMNIKNDTPLRRVLLFSFLQCSESKGQWIAVGCIQFIQSPRNCTVSPQRLEWI